MASHSPIPPLDSSCVSNSRPVRTITATNGDDTLIGTPGNGIINSLARNNGINGFNGADIIKGGLHPHVIEFVYKLCRQQGY